MIEDTFWWISKSKDKIIDLSKKHALFQIKPHRFSSLPKVPAVYLITFLSSGKQYVGSTKNLNARAGAYIRKEFNQRPQFDCSDSDDIFISMLYDCSSMSVADRLALEYEYIVNINTIFPYGLNKKHPVTGKTLHKLLVKYNTNPDRIRLKSTVPYSFLIKRRMIKWTI